MVANERAFLHRATKEKNPISAPISATKTSMMETAQEYMMELAGVSHFG